MAELQEKNPGIKHTVSVALGYTSNMKDFESLRTDFSLEIDGYGNPDPTFQKAYDWVEAKLVQKVAELRQELAK